MCRSYKDHNYAPKKKTPRQSHKVKLSPYKRDKYHNYNEEEE